MDFVDKIWCRAFVLRQLLIYTILFVQTGITCNYRSVPDERVETGVHAQSAKTAAEW